MPTPKDPKKFEEYRKRQSEIAKARGFGQWMKGEKWSKKTRRKMMKEFKRRAKDPEHRKRLSVAAKMWYGKMDERKNNTEKNSRQSSSPQKGKNI